MGTLGKFWENNTIETELFFYIWYFCVWHLHFQHHIHSSPTNHDLRGLHSSHWWRRNATLASLSYPSYCLDLQLREIEQLLWADSENSDSPTFTRTENPTLCISDSSKLLSFSVLLFCEFWLLLRDTHVYFQYHDSLLKEKGKLRNTKVIFLTIVVYALLDVLKKQGFSIV